MSASTVSPAVVVGDDWHRARTVEEMKLAASLRPCPTCGAIDAYDLVASLDARRLRGSCRSCRTPIELTFVVEGEPERARWPARFEIGDERPSTIIEPRALTAELERLRAAGIDDTNRERALTCVMELLKFVLIANGARGEELVALRDRLLVEEGVGTPVGSPTIDSLARAIFTRARGPLGVARLGEMLGADLQIRRSPSTRAQHAEVSTGGPLLRSVELDWTDDDTVEAWTATFAHGADDFQRCLRRQLGSPRRLPSHHVYGEAFLIATRGQEFRLSWYAELPDWAAPPVDVAVRGRTLSRIVEAGTTNALPRGCGLFRASAHAERIDLHLRPAMPVTDFVQVPGFEGLVVHFPVPSFPQTGGIYAPVYYRPPSHRWLKERSDGKEVDLEIDGARLEIVVARERDVVVRIHLHLHDASSPSAL